MFFSKKDNKEEFEDTISLKRNIIEYYNNSLELEIEKEKSINRKCSTMILSNTLMLLPLIIIIFELYNRLTSVRTLITIFGMIEIGVILLALLFTLLAENNSGNTEVNKIVNEGFSLDYVMNNLNNLNDTKKKNNNKRIKLLRVAYIFNYIFFGLLVAFGTVIMIVL